jgi:LmbE family N-acetylglucosaminyl deacetylase
MKRVWILLICIALLLLPTIRRTKAESTAAEDLTAHFTFDFGSYRDAKSLVLKDREQYQTFGKQASFSLTREETSDGARLCLAWQTPPEDVRVLQYDAEGALLSDDALPSYPDTVTPLRADAQSAVVQAGDAGMRVLFCAVYGPGELPDPFHEWKETPDRLDYLLIATHPDDDVLYLGSVVPVYGAEREYVGTIVYVTASNRTRISEAENGAWAMGLRYRPVFFGMQDIWQGAAQNKKSAFRYEELLEKTVRAYRSMRPLVVFAQDLKGEYGHWQHKLTAKAAREAFALAADPAYDPESAAQYGTWQVQKLFLHLYSENTIQIDAHAPLSFFDGKDAYEVARKAFLKHETQQRYHFRVSRDNKRYAFNRFGMAEGIVPAGEDVFDNVDETLLCSYIPPTPEPTAAPTRGATAVPTVPGPVLTPAATEPPAALAAEAEAQTKDATPLIWIGVSTVAAALAVGVAAYFWKKRQIEKHGDCKDPESPV